MAEQTETTQSQTLVGSRTGIVTSKSTAKTIHVTVNAVVKHPQYGKYVRKRTKLAVHDPENKAAEGDLVEIAPCRRVSKTKSWRLVRIVRAGFVPESPTTADKGQVR
jgi:small subunit ribosomal protein S17